MKTRCLILGMGLNFLLMGCFVGRVYEGAELNLKKTEEIVQGKTNKDEIISWFGPPKTFTRPILIEEVAESLRLAQPQKEGTIFHEVFTYEYKRGNVFILLLFLYNYVELDIKSDYLVFFFNEKGTVENWSLADDIALIRKLGFLSGSPDRPVSEENKK